MLVCRSTLQTHDLAVIFDEFDKPKAGSIFLLSRLLFHLLLLILGLLLFVLRFIAVATKRVKLAHDQCVQHTARGSMSVM